MQFFSIAYLYIVLANWYRLRSQQNMYRRVVANAIREGSVLFSETTTADTAVWQSNVSRSNEIKLLEDNHVVLFCISPQKIVNLSEWTSYLEGACNYTDVKQEMLVLLEAVECNTTDCELTVAEANTVSVEEKMHGSVLLGVQCLRCMYNFQ